MGAAKTTLEYISLSTGNWTTAVTSDGNDAVIMLAVDQSINSSAKADIILSNRPANPASSDPADAKGLLTDAFSDFQRIRLIHQEIGIPIFSGRIYRLRDVYDMQYGQTIRIVAFDAFKEFLEYPIEDSADSLKKINTTSSNVGGYDVRKRSQLIKYILDEMGLKDKNLLSTDADQFEDSWSTDSLLDKSLDVTKLDRNLGGVIQDLAIADPVKNQGGTHIGDSGYDYRVEPRWVSSALTSKPIESLHYFMRGTRPGKGGAYGGSAAPILTNTSTDSLKIEYSNEDSGVDSGLKQTMMPQFEFDKPRTELYTSIVCHYMDESREDESNDNESGGKTEGTVTFELLKGTALSGTFTWAGKALDATKNTTNVPEWLTHGGNNVARVQWQNTAGFLLLISHINEATFPTSNTNVTLTGATSGQTFVFNAATGRMKTKYGVERPVRLQRNLSSGLNVIRDEIVSKLIGRIDLEIVRSKFQTITYPIVYHNLPSNASRSSNTITWSGTVVAKARGIRVGHIVTEIDSSGSYVRYAYISAVNSDTSITYGSSATDTSDGTALNSSNTIRLVIPLRPGDVIKVIAATNNIDTDQVILNLGYDESPGMISARYETVGSNNKFNNIYSEANSIRAAVAAATPKNFPPTKPLGEASFFFTGFINRGVNPSGANNYRQIHWTNAAGDTSGTAGTLTVGDGSRYTIACANSAILTTADHTIFFRPTTARSTANTSDTTFQIVLTTSYTKDPDDILIGWCNASDAKAGAKAVLVLAPQISSKDLFSAGQNGTLTEALLSKSAQEYSSGLEIVPVTSGSDRHLQVTWAACTATSGANSTDERLTFGDGDAWLISAKSGSNYSVTTNGSTYANITALVHSSTYYAFVDTADTASGGTLTLRFTTKYKHISTADDGTFSSSRVIMAQIAVPTNGDNGAAPRVFPFNNRSLTINAASIAADAITATHITAGAISTGKLTTDLQGDITEKTITTVSNTAPTSPTPRTGDLWFDTSGSVTVIKVYDSTTSPYWILRNSNEGDTIGGTIFHTAIASPPSANAIYDLWMTTDTDQLYIAKSATADEIASNEWVLKDDADAINYAQTEINGGLIKTQRIKLLQGGSLNISASGNAFETTQTVVVSTLRLIDESGGIDAVETTFGIDAWSNNGGNPDDLYIYAGDVIQIDDEVMYVEAGGTIDNEGVFTISVSDTAIKVIRGWFGTTPATHDDNDLISKYNYELYTGTTAFTNPHIILDNNGIVGYSNAYSPEFSLSSVTGKGSFAGGAAVLDNAGLTITGGTDTTSFLTFKAGNATNLKVYASGNDVTLTNQTVTGTIIISTSAGTKISGDLIPSSAGGGNLGTTANYWGWAKIQYLAAEQISARTGGLITVMDNLKTFDYIMMSGASNSTKYLYFGTSTSGDEEWGIRSDDGTMQAKNRSGSWAGLGHNTDNVGVHTGVVTGTGININRGLDTGGEFLFRGINTGDEDDISITSGWYLRRSSSSIRWKDNIRSIEIDTSKVLTLTPKTFTWKDIEGVGEESRGKDDFGLIAEEVYEIIPELVTYDENNNPSGVQYKKISVLLLEEVKNLKARIEVLEGN